MRKWLVSLALALALVLAMAACSSDDGGEPDSDAKSDQDTGRRAELKEAGTIQVGVADEKAYAYEEDGELKGVAVDVATEVLKSLGIDNVEGHLSDFGELIPGLQAKKYDIITASMAITGDRCENAAFGNPEVLYGEGLIVQAGNPRSEENTSEIQSRG